MPERRWHVYRLLKKLLDGRTGSKSAGTYLRHFTEALCRAEITIAIVIIGCVMRTMRLGWTRKSHPIVCRASRFDRKRQSDRKNIHTSPRPECRPEKYSREEKSIERDPALSDSAHVGSARIRDLISSNDPESQPIFLSVFEASPAF